MNLPQGGGAIRGMGETFRMDPVTGTAGAGIPLPITPSPRGLAPSLALSYDSGLGQGPFGLGWALDQPRITRKTDKRLPSYVDNHAYDVFILSGAGELVPKLDESGDRIVTETETHRIRPFLARDEGSFSRIDLLVDKTTQTSSWRVTSRDNVTTYFGETSAARITDPKAERKTLTYLISRTEDDRGNLCVYDYKEEDTDNIPVRTSERYRREKPDLIVNRYLKRVRYGNTVMHTPGEEPSSPVLDSCAFELLFDYGEHDLEAPTPDETETWPSRQDPSSSYRAGFEIRTYRLCQRVLMFHKFEELGEDPYLVRALEIAYEEDPRRTLLTGAAVRAYGPDAEGDPSSAMFPAVTFAYTSDAIVTKNAVKALKQDDMGLDFPVSTMGKNTQWIDLHGDGLPGLLIDQGDTLRYKRNLGGGLMTTSVPLQNQPGLTTLQKGHNLFLNVTGSGNPSLVSLRGTDRGYHERQGDGWGPFIPFRSAPVVDITSPNVQIVDLNGDGFSDILVTEGSDLVWYPSLGKDGWAAPIRIPVGIWDEKGPAVYFANTACAVMLADMSGDGLPDIVRVTRTTVDYWPNLGFGRFGHIVKMDHCPELDPHEYFDAGNVKLIDLDGTGCADLLYFHWDGLRIYRNQSGNGFSDKTTVHAVRTIAPGTLSLVDFHGNGMTQILWALTTQLTSSPGNIYTPFAEKPLLLKEVDNHMGKLVRIQYAPSTKFSRADERKKKPWVTKLPMVVQCVERVETYDAISRTRLITTYAYHHGHYNAFEREFRGFGCVEQLDA